MKTNLILIIFIVTSSMLFLPLIKPDTTVKLINFEENSVIVNIQSPEIHVESNIDAVIQMNISRLDVKSNSLDTIWDKELIKKQKIEIDLRGNFLFVFFSESQATITISEGGLPISTIIYVIIVAVTAVAYTVKRLAFPSIDV